MNDNKDKVLFYIKEFTKRHGYTPTTYQVSNELYMPQGSRERNKIKAAVAQSVERRIGSAEVTGPIPVSSSVNPLMIQGIFCCPDMDSATI